MELIDLISNWLSTLNLKHIRIIDYDGESHHIRIDGPFTNGYMFQGMANICRIFNDHVFCYAWAYDLVTHQTAVIVAGQEETIYASDPDFFKKLETNIKAHIEFLKPLENVESDD